MKKFFVSILGLSIILAFSSCGPNDDEPQEPKEEVFVSKTLENRKVILEEYTGINCGYCPDGHRRADSLSKLWPNQFWAINIHAGNLAAAYTTNEGTTLFNSFGVSAIPTGAVSRELVNLGDNKYAYAINRGAWGYVAEQLFNQKAYANVAAKTTIKKSTRQLTCKVQVYFTDSVTVAEGKNFVNIVLLQDNIWGAQVNGETFYPAMYDKNTGKYKHNHMLRTFITGVSGEAIPKNKKGELYSKTFTYTIPETISNEAVVIDDLSVLVFVSQADPTQAMKITKVEDMPRIINACKSSIKIE
ncbi:MAG TPA: Omp28-related outer membrane protein [Bacteroidales bacterium]|nr:Omp28-related outer membrane protein [Bacteroidales bacterium]HON20709.1 Omp28-related outer membrane protein [Bacteroidales bacterium]HOR82245.1 Omp28-related outer membrane protein [Bacteroidales bacterium]HPJ91543.1 Omp28-related outer membrane protein [Bacteroidales bacterium]